MKRTLTLLTALLLAPLAALHAAETEDWKVAGEPEIPKSIRVERDVVKPSVTSVDGRTGVDFVVRKMLVSSMLPVATAAPSASISTASS